MLSIYRNYFLFSLIYLVPNLFTFTTASCNLNPCVYGECEQLANTYVCHCPPGIKGDRCNLLLTSGEDPCLQKPCWNDATCRSSGSRWICDCKPGFTGVTCRDEKTTAECTPNYCQNGGVCRIVKNKPFCFCNADFTGAQCENLIPLCDRRNPCLNGGICDKAFQICRCPPAFTGENCEKPNQINEPTMLNLKVKNLGWYTAYVEIRYTNFNGVSRAEGVVIFGLGGQHTFRYSKNSNDVWLVADAVGGKRFYNVPIETTPDTRCYHLWGNVFDPKGTPMNCDQF